MEKKKKGRGWSEKGTVEEAWRGGGFSFIPSIPFFLGRFFWRAKNPKRKKGSWRGWRRRGVGEEQSAESRKAAPGPCGCLGAAPLPFFFKFIYFFGGKNDKFGTGGNVAGSAPSWRKEEKGTGTPKALGTGKVRLGKRPVLVVLWLGAP